MQLENYFNNKNFNSHFNLNSTTTTSKYSEDTTLQTTTIKKNIITFNDIEKNAVNIYPSIKISQKGNLLQKLKENPTSSLLTVLILSNRVEEAMEILQQKKFINNNNNDNNNDNYNDKIKNINNDENLNVSLYNSASFFFFFNLFILSLLALFFLIC
jgi:hypothetical protein